MTPPRDSTDPRALRDLAFFCLCTLLLLPSIWSPCSITGQDEYWLSFRTVLEMQERGEWLTPYVNGEVRLQKPPLLYWLMRGSFLLFGPTLFAARIWTVLAGAGMALYCAKLARRYQPNGYLAGLMVVSAAGVMIDARRAMFDLPVGCLCTIAIYYSIVGYSSGRLRPALTAAVALAAAAMTKGPVACWFFAAAMLAALLTRRARPAGPWWHWLVALAVFLGLAAAWPLWAQAHYPEFLQVMRTQTEDRRIGLAQLQRIPALLAAVLGLVVPWSIAVLAASWRGLRERSTPTAPARWLLAWLLIGLLPFAFMKSFERYMLALVCPMAMLAAHWLASSNAIVQRRHLILASSLVAIPVAIFATFVAWFEFSYLWPSLAMVLLGITINIARQQQPNLLLTAGLCAALFSLLLGGIYPAIGINGLPRNLPDDLHTAPVMTFARPQPGLLSMHLQRSVQQMNGADIGLSERLANYHGYLFVLERDVARVEAAAQSGNLPLQRVGDFRSFYSRKAWLKFYRAGITWHDWREALQTRSAKGLKPRFVYYRLP